MKNVFTTGSVKELWSVSSSLAVSFFSMFMMMFIDRIFLTKYSQDALQAASTAGTGAWALLFGIVTMISMSEVVVAQRNGAKEFTKLGQPVWQMIYFTLLVTPLLFVLAPFLAEAFFLPTPYNHEYFTWSIYMSPAYLLLTAITAFFVGQGKASIIKWLAIIGNGLNVGLDYIFIFGIDGIFPSLGVKGAIIATGASTLFQAIILFYLFVSKNNRQEFGSADTKFRPNLFLQCLKLGAPPGIFVMFEVGGWALFYRLMSTLSPLHIQSANIVQSLLFLYFFFGCALEKGASAVAGNLIGQGLEKNILRLVRSGTILCVVFLIITTIANLFFVDMLVPFLINETGHIDDMQALLSIIKSALPLITVYLFFENFRWVLSGILSAAGDTFFLMISGFCSAWFFLLIPTYFFVVLPAAPPITSFIIWVIYSMLAIIPIYFRFKSGIWKNPKRFTAHATENAMSIASNTNETDI